LGQKPHCVAVARLQRDRAHQAIMSLMCGGGGGDGGGGGGAEGPTKEEEQMDRELKKLQSAESEKETKIVKMLLLGAGESGKSTIFKQMKVINKSGYSDKEKKEFKTIVHSNVCASMRSILDAAPKLNVELTNQADCDKFMELAYGGTPEKLTPELGELIVKIWANESIKALFTRRNEFQLNDSAEYYFDKVTVIAADGYVPDEGDILRSRVRTTGIVQSEFAIKGLNFCMFDVGGQRNERRKWIHCFDNVNAVVFVASLSEFDQKLYEDETKNRLDEAVELFKQIVNSKWFTNSSLILFLNKKDLFEKKLQEKTFGDYVKEYTGTNEMKPCAEYVKELMLKQQKDKSKSVFAHITTAIDTSNVKFVFNAVVAMILEANLKASGLA